MTEESWIIFGMAAVILLLGVLFGAVSYGMGVSQRRKKERCTFLTRGTVSDVRQETSRWTGDDTVSVSWYAFFTYEVGGQTITRRSSLGHAKKPFETGQSVTVHYNPAKPEEFYVEEEDMRPLLKLFWLVSGILLLVGVLLLVILLLWN